ncbi:MAG: nicotinate-nucleotide adenylyltransferase [Defluviitaleaceae bacterium]|nr:nicotinate-nucleotide adenylyltransferase [Defluviitaleaceae bacterium]
MDTRFLTYCNKLAILGGTFDPLHNGHLAVAEAVRDAFEPQCVLFIPSGQPPHKQEDKPVTDTIHRYNMVLSAICTHPFFDVSRLEIDRQGLSYTVDTIEDLRRICPASAEIFFVVGADALMEIHTWHGADRLLKLCKIIAVHRPGYEVCNETLENLRASTEVHLLEGPNLAISGTMVREKFHARQALGGLIPRSVEAYARAHSLYNLPPVTLSQERFEAIKSVLQQRLSPRRFRHTLGTVAEAEKLALRYGADVNNARWAALLHDCAKEYSADKKRELCKTWGIELDEIISKDIDVTHGWLGAESARRDFYVTEHEILQAISRHTIGGSGMSLLDKIIMLADYIEPHRDPAYPPLAKMREQAYVDINKALVIGISDTIGDLEERGKAVHPCSRSVLAELQLL